MSQPEWINNEWKLENILGDPAFQKFIDGLFKCEHVTRITLLGSIVLEGREPFNRFPDHPEGSDIDIGMEYDHRTEEMKPWYGISTSPVVEYLKQFGLKSRASGQGYRPLIYVPSPLAPEGYYGKKYVIHVAGKPQNDHIVLRERPC